MTDALPLAADPDLASGAGVVAAAAAAGVETMFTLSGAHVFPLYDAAHRGRHRLRMVDVRHEASAIFAAEAVGKLTRTPGFAVVTAGPGVTNALSPVTQAHFSGAPLVVFGGRAPEAGWGRGALQELDQAPLFASVTKASGTAHTPQHVGPYAAAAFAAAGAAHRGPVFLDAAIDTLFSPVPVPGTRPGNDTSLPPFGESPRRPPLDPGAIAAIAALLGDAVHPVIVLGSDVWADGAEVAALELVDELGIPAITNGMGRGVVPAGHPGLVTKARRPALRDADLVIVVGTPLDFRLSYGAFGTPAAPARVVHIVDSPDQRATNRPLDACAAGDLAAILTALTAAVTPRAQWTAWRTTLADHVARAEAADAELLCADGDLIHPARIYGELLPRLSADTVVIGDGGDFVSWAGKFVEPTRPGRWLDPGPFGCLGAGLGAAIGARCADPDNPVVLLLGDGAAGMSLMDVDTLVRHDLPVVMIVGNNSAWGLERGPMRALYGYDILADLAPDTRYDRVVTALGGAGEMITDAAALGPAIDRALAAGVPYLLNVVTDPDAVYPRATTGL